MSLLTEHTHTHESEISVVTRVEPERVHVARKYRRRVFGQHQRFSVEFTALWIVSVSAVMLLTQGAPRAFLTGGLVVAASWLVWWVVTTGDAAYRTRRDALAESWTGQELERLCRDGWRVFHVVEFQEFDIDHVIVGPGGVWAVRTKWTPGQPMIGETKVDGTLRNAADQAWWSARRLRDYLRDNGADVSIQAAVVVWGPQVPTVVNGLVRVRAVDVVVGAQAHEWRQELACRRGIPEASMNKICSLLEPLLERGAVTPG